MKSNRPYCNYSGGRRQHADSWFTLYTVNEAAVHVRRVRYAVLKICTHCECGEYRRKAPDVICVIVRCDDEIYRVDGKVAKQVSDDVRVRASVDQYMTSFGGSYQRSISLPDVQMNNAKRLRSRRIAARPRRDARSQKSADTQR